MKKSLLIMIAFLTLFSYSPVQAETVTNNDVQLRDDLIYILLTPLINKEIEKHYGKPKQFYNKKILQIKKLEQGSYYFDVTVQVTTFEGAHNPPNDLVTITFSNHRYPGWRAIDFKSRRLKPNEDQYRHP
ncbi:DUF3888 domain-containing protein [Neobacillus niacini]|uniref:DUF3888 domain-containing protein n=1 Tax=Neobacillus niacini TaxID=86668 RepID=UPI0006941FD7|nr:DUF3888 domain-containing protein [Neobacillus niacini]